MKAAILTLALSVFLLGASAAYVKASGGFTCKGNINVVGNSCSASLANGRGSTGLPSHCNMQITLSCG